MNDDDLTLDEVAQALTVLAERVAAVERAHEELGASLARERDVQRHTLMLLAQLLEKQTASLHRIEEKMAAQPSEPAPPRRQAVVKGQVMVARPNLPPPPVKKAPPPEPMPMELEFEPAPPPEPLPEPEIEQQITQAIGNISAMLKKKEAKRRKGG